MNRKKYDFIMKGATYLATSFTAFILLAIILFTFSSGSALISWDLITGDYHPEAYTVEIMEIADTDFCNCDYVVKQENEFFSGKWGFALAETENKEGEDVIQFTYIDEDSPLLHGIKIDGSGSQAVEVGSNLNSYIQTDEGIAGLSGGAENIINHMELSSEINWLSAATEGGGIWGSIVTTIMLVVTTLIIAVPFGVLTAIYMNEYAGKSKIIKFTKAMIDTLTGVPSVIFGLMGAAVFVPMVGNLNGGNGHLGSVLAGALTMSVILLPVIVKTTTQALKQVPMDLRRASFALGATKTQTTFKVVLSNTIPGIISGIILGIGRIVGESAALIFTAGSLISDNPDLFDRSTSLAVHIWTVMGGDNPNFELASAIALIILIVVLFLNVTVKLISMRFNKMGRA